MSLNIRLPPLATIRDLIRMYQLRAQKQLSQNFLLDQRVTDKIVKSAGALYGKWIIEVGPGPGSITRSIIRKSPRQLVVVEKDERFRPMLEQLEEACKPHMPMKLVFGDIRNCTLEEQFTDTHECRMDWHGPTPPIHIIGNLPFNVSTNLIIRWLHAISERRSVWSLGRAPMTLTFQKEVAERIVAPPADDQRCRLSVISQMYCQVEHKFNIPGSAFLPKPEVDVGVVNLIPLKEPLIKLPFKMVEKVLRTIFNMRQKYSKRGAERLFPEDSRSELVLRLFTLADVDFHIRPFQLSNEEYVRLCYAYKVMCEEMPHLSNYDSRAPKHERLLASIANHPNSSEQLACNL